MSGCRTSGSSLGLVTNLLPIPSSLSASVFICAFVIKENGRSLTRNQITSQGPVCWNLAREGLSSLWPCPGIQRVRLPHLGCEPLLPALHALVLLLLHARLLRPYRLLHPSPCHLRQHTLLSLGLSTRTFCNYNLPCPMLATGHTWLLNT